MTLIGPDVAPTGPVVVMWVADTIVNVALAPLNATRVAPVKLAPSAVTDVGPGRAADRREAGDLWYP